ncbi:hypothetical protein N7517_006282 [Penicillium concentricum]|uniref:Uncharacterized protein n=1 Tax=Penicillium concentricum TaxID=293559 RepID=A0A9W9VCD5_9EURO|nr:uncharacterized protein N7517_006282 [Penicillium concentricum]KAJ5374276.1 hypothetical protein N7517_006282 [Penicillium concentricum]
MATFNAGVPATTGYRKAPDLVIIDDRSAIRVIGDTKTLWPDDHIDMLSEGIRDFETRLEKKSCWQVARYMQQLDITHGFLSTYDETIFLRKIGFKEFGLSNTLLWSNPAICMSPKWNISPRDKGCCIKPFAEDMHMYLIQVALEVTGGGPIDQLAQDC